MALCRTVIGSKTTDDNKNGNGDDNAAMMMMMTMTRMLMMTMMTMMTMGDCCFADLVGRQQCREHLYSAVSHQQLARQPHSP